MTSNIFEHMRKLFSVALALIIGLSSYAQNRYSADIMNGDVKMHERFYQMALNYYNKALTEATTQTEKSAAQDKIKACKAAMTEKEDAPALKSKPASSTAKKTSAPSSAFVFSDQYLENGDVFDSDNQTVSATDGEVSQSLYTFEVYGDRLVITSHVDCTSSIQLSSMPAGTVLKLVDETDEMRVYASDRKKECFLIFKDVFTSGDTKYRRAMHLVGDVLYMLYPSCQVPKLPIKFTESWAMNIDDDEDRLGDTREAPLKADEVCYLLFRVRYVCPEDFNKAVVFGVKVFDPDGNLIDISDEAVSGYSSCETLNTVGGGGIFNYVIGDANPGTLESGTYRFEIWDGINRCYSSTITLR